MAPRVRVAITLMQDDLRRERSLNVLARSVELSPSRFQHLFKAETGMAPTHYLRTLRIEHARKLLETSLLSVKLIMKSVGIEDKSHFSREFKKAYGLTPTDYRAAHSLAGEVRKA